MTRHERIVSDMTHLARLGVIEPNMYTQGDMPGVRWNFVPCGFTERSLTTSQVEDFILGARAALNAAKEASDMSLRPRVGETPEDTVDRVVRAAKEAS